RLRSIPGKLRGTPRAPLLAYLVAAIAAAAISGPFITPYLLHYQGLGYVQYSVFTATIVVSKIVFLPALGRLIQRVGVRRVLTICALGIAPIPLFWVVSDAFLWLLCMQLYGGIAWGGFELGVLMVLFDADDDAERTTLQVAFSALQAMGTAGASLIGAALLASLGTDHTAYVWVFLTSALARAAAALLLVRELPRVLVRLPALVVIRAWTIAIRPWGGTIVRPIVEGIGRLSGRRGGEDEGDRTERRGRRDDDP
nr:MFS transporter [Deltaproteobacteria bacterium]